MRRPSDLGRSALSPGRFARWRPDERLAGAYADCERMTRAAAANFYYGIRLLPAHERAAMCAVYAFARRVDDIGDGQLPVERKRELLNEQQLTLTRALNGDPGLGADSVMMALAATVTRFELPADALSELIAGIQMDLEPVSFDRFDDLLLYCQRVAGGIGRLSVAIFGARSPSRASVLADELGVAMQLTNIVRDLREDTRNGRVYLPCRELRQFGVLSAEDPSEAAAQLSRVLADPGHGNWRALEALVHFQVRRATVWFERGGAVIDLLDRRSGACVLAMSGIYRALLRRIDSGPRATLTVRCTLPAWEKTLIALRSLVRVAT